MKPFRVCFLFICYLTIIIITFVTESVQEDNVLQFRPVSPTDPSPKFVVYCPLKLHLRERRIASTTSSMVTKRGNQFKNFMLSKDTSKDAANRVQKGSYIPVKSNGKRDDSTSTDYDIYTEPSDMDIFQKWLSSYYLQ
ncbi:uncharacterized protein LOC114127284 [Aphis gossypii]|uniref:Uncharacterized protein n=1 Tax=Aphis gossypii TaxID=80765 RepID=A0A9P0J1D1_APHGO|nr:uncharacterized protein LOC114127284 [Aphis gossypii]CAH1723927.1 unnamed protein product [Aphis gossypii]